MFLFVVRMYVSVCVCERENVRVCVCMSIAVCECASSSVQPLWAQTGGDVNVCVYQNQFHILA